VTDQGITLRFLDGREESRPCGDGPLPASLRFTFSKNTFVREGTRYVGGTGWTCDDPDSRVFVETVLQDLGHCSGSTAENPCYEPARFVVYDPDGTPSPGNYCAGCAKTAVDEYAEIIGQFWSFVASKETCDIDFRRNRPTPGAPCRGYIDEWDFKRHEWDTEPRHHLGIKMFDHRGMIGECPFVGDTTVDEILTWVREKYPDTKYVVDSRDGTVYRFTEDGK